MTKWKLKRNFGKVLLLRKDELKKLHHHHIVGGEFRNYSFSALLFSRISFRLTLILLSLKTLQEIHKFNFYYKKIICFYFVL